MTVEMFLQNFGMRYERIPTHITAELSDLIKDMSDEDLHKLWRAFIDEYTYTTIPQRAVFVKLMKENGLKRHKGDNVYFYRCQNCYKTWVYPQMYCPNCRGTEHTLHKDDKYLPNCDHYFPDRLKPDEKGEVRQGLAQAFFDRLGEAKRYKEK